MKNLFDFPVCFPVVNGRRMKGREEGNGADFLGEREDTENEAEEHCVCTFQEHLVWTGTHRKSGNELLGAKMGIPNFKSGERKCRESQCFRENQSLSIFPDFESRFSPFLMKKPVSHF